MDFGKLERVDGVDFALPPVPARSRRGLAAQPPPGDEPWLVLGAPAWARKDWLGKVYPTGTPQKDFLRVYARRFGAIELNASYYHVPERGTLEGWCADVPEDFVFCPKLHRELTHDGRGLHADDAPERAADIVAHFAGVLGERLGPFFVQLPPHFGPADAAALDRVLAAMNEASPRRPLAHVEWRHPACFAAGELIAPLTDLLARRRAGTVITDVAGRRDVCHATLTAPELFVRFVGNGLHPSDFTRAEAWLDRLAELRAGGLRRAFLFIHQPDDLLAPELLDFVQERATRRGLGLQLPSRRGQLGLF